MSKQLVITEKPSVARDIVEALGGFDESEGFWESDRYLVTFAVGHLFELLEPEDLDPKYKRWTLDTLPIIPETFALKPKEGQGERLRTIKQLLTREEIDGVINACDAGREGELIFREIVDYHGVAKPVMRLWLQSMTKGAIRQGFAALKDGEAYRGLRDAAYCRTYSDWLIGMNATRALTRRLKSRSESQAWSAGRVQTPTLAMLVDRELEILVHTPVPYWKIAATFAHESAPYPGTWFDPTKASAAEDPEGQTREDRIFDEARAQQILARVQGKPGVASETRKPSREAAPLLFDLTSLQREANRRYGWSARRTLNAAQRCYEVHKTLTYPRTDTRALPEDYVSVVEDVIKALGADPRFTEASKYLGANGLLNGQRIFDNSKVTDHFAIVPTGVLPERPLEGDDARLYDLVARRFLSAFYPPAVWSRVERITVVDGESFRSRAKTLQEPGWRSVHGDVEAGENESALPPLVPGKDEVDGVAVQSSGYELVREETKPPARITEGRLLSLMENAGEQVIDEDTALALKDKGIGTPATRADIIENLIRKGYVVRSGKALRPTVKGIRLIDVLRRMHADRLASPRLTGEMEQHLSEVEHERRKPEQFMDEIRDYTREIVDRTKKFEFDVLFPDDEALGNCPLCGKPVYERSWFYRCKEPEHLEQDRKRKRAAKAGDAEAAAEPEVETPPADCPFRIWKDKAGRYIDRQTVRELLKDGKTRVLDGFTTRQGRTYRGQLELDHGEITLRGVAGGGDSDDGSALDTPEYEVDDRPLGTCPKCKAGQVVETRATFICSNGLDTLKKLGRDEATTFVLKEKEIPEGATYCSFLLPRTVCKREITREEAQQYIAEQKTPLLTDFISQRGRPFSAILLLRDTGRHGFEFPPRGEGKTAAPKKEAKAPAEKKTAAKKKAAPKKKAADKGGEKAEAKPAAKKKAAAKRPAAKAKKGKAAKGTSKSARPTKEKPSTAPHASS